MFAIWIPSLARSFSVFGSSMSCFCWFNHSLFLYLIFGDVPKDVPNQIYFTAHLCFWFQYFLLLLSCFHDYFRVPKWRFPEIGLSPAAHHPFLVGDLEHGFYFSIYWECHHPIWLSNFSEGEVYHQPDRDFPFNHPFSIGIFHDKPALFGYPLFSWLNPPYFS